MKKLSYFFIILVFLLISFSAVEAIKYKGIFEKKKFVSLNNLETTSIQSNQSSAQSVIIKGDIKKLNYFKDINITYTLSDSVSAQVSTKTLNLLKNDSALDVLTFPEYFVDLQDSTRIINATSTWKIVENSKNLTGLGQTVCILDSGIDYNHPDLASSYLNVGYDFINNDSNPLDDDGHGTHVAGIVHGVAPDAKIIAMKVCNSLGSCNGTAIALSIDWCVTNKNLYNISVISMSLGTNCANNPGSCSTNYCNSDSLTSYVNSAVANNISVVVSSGNNYISNLVSSPGCIENVTTVTSSTKSDDAISDFANTWDNSSLLILAAPGENINSTCLLGDIGYSNGYCIKDGTSMAAPHVSGAIAIIKQYLNLTSIKKNNSEIKSLLNSTGKQIYDLYADRNFSRIDIYSAIFFLKKPYVNLNSPLDYHVNNRTNEEFNCSSESHTSNYILKNITFYLWNSTDLVYTNSTNISGTTNSSVFNYNIVAEDNYLWNCLSFNNISESAFAFANYSITYDSIPPNLTLIEPFPGDQTSSSATKTFNYSVSDNLNIKNCSLIVNDVVNQTNSSINKNINQSFIGIFAPGAYNWSINCSDLGGNDVNSSTWNFTITAPIVSSGGGGGSRSSSSSSVGGGGGGGGNIIIPQTINLNEQEINLGITKLLNAKDKITFLDHSLTVNNITNYSIDLTIRSDPINITIWNGQERKLNLSNANYYDLYIKLENIISGKANLTIKVINESIFPEYNIHTTDSSNITNEKEDFFDFKDVFGINNYIVIGIILCIIAFLMFVNSIVYKKVKKSIRKKRKKKVKDVELNLFK